MKILNAFIPVVLLVIGAGCQSREPETVSHSSLAPAQNMEQNPQHVEQDVPTAVPPQEPNATTIQQITTGKVTYTIQTIPNPRLTPTSREGDNSNQVYSSNIISVYVHPRNAGTVSLADSTVVSHKSGPVAAEK